MNSTTTKKKKLFSHIISGILSIMLGVMSVFAGLKVLLEIDTKDYNVLVWLVQYNVFLGAISIVVAVFIFENLKIAKSSILFVLSAYFIVLIYLKFFSSTVANESIKAMLFRVGIWLFITFIYILLPKLINKKQTV